MSMSPDELRTLEDIKSDFDVCMAGDDFTGAQAKIANLKDLGYDQAALILQTDLDYKTKI